MYFAKSPLSLPSTLYSLLSTLYSLPSNPYPFYLSYSPHQPHFPLKIPVHLLSLLHNSIKSVTFAAEC